MVAGFLSDYTVQNGFNAMDEWIIRMFVVFSGLYALTFLWAPPYLQLVREIYRSSTAGSTGSLASLDAIRKQWTSMWAFLGLFVSAWLTGVSFLLGFLLQGRPVLFYMVMSLNHAIWAIMAIWTSWNWLPARIFSKKQIRSVRILIYTCSFLNFVRLGFGIWAAVLEDKDSNVFLFYRIYAMICAFSTLVAQAYLARLVSKCVIVLQNTSLSMVQNINDVLNSDATPFMEIMSNRSNGTAILILREIVIANSLLAAACFCDIFQQYLLSLSLESIVVCFGVFALMSQSRVLNYSLEQQRDKAIARRQHVISFANLAFSQSKARNLSSPVIRSTVAL